MVMAGEEHKFYGLNWKKVMKISVSFCNISWTSYNVKNIIYDLINKLHLITLFKVSNIFVFLRFPGGNSKKNMLVVMKINPEHLLKNEINFRDRNTNRRLYKCLQLLNF